MAVGKLTKKSFWTKLGQDVRDLYKQYIFEEGKNVYGGKWWGGSYSAEYKKAKSSGNLPRQASAYKDQVTAVLTTQTQSDFEGFMKPRANGVQLGYPSRGHIVADLRKRGGKAGTLTSEKRPLPKPLSRYIRNEYHKFVKRNQKNTTRTHKGKKK